MDQPKATILLAEDETSLAHIVRESLEERGYKVIVCANGEIAIQKFEATRPNLVVLDIMMPKMDGYAVAKKIRSIDEYTPIIFLTAKTQVKDVVAGFEHGANDYLKKPFSIEELIVRIQVQLSKKGTLETKKATVDRIKIAGFNFYPTRHQLEKDGVVRTLTARESDVLKYLYQSKQDVADRSSMLKQLWGNDNFFNARSLDVFIAKLRKYLSADANVKIINVRGIGYKLVY